MDKAMLRLNYVNGRRKIHYKFLGEENRDPLALLATNRPQFSKQIMFDAGPSYRGESPVYFIDPEAKVNSAYFIENILKTMMQEKIPRLYGANAPNVVFHMDVLLPTTPKQQSTG
jgi:hypothetical protein